MLYTHLILRLVFLPLSIYIILEIYVSLCQLMVSVLIFFKATEYSIIGLPWVLICIVSNILFLSTMLHLITLDLCHFRQIQSYFTK